MRGIEIDEELGLWSAYTPDGFSATANSLEALLDKLDPGAPVAVLAAAAEVLHGIIARHPEVDAAA